MSLRPRHPVGGDGVIASQSGPLPRLGGGSIQAKRFGATPSATPRKALGDLGNLGQGGLKESAKKPTTLLVVGGGGGGSGLPKERAGVPRPGGSKISSLRSRALEDELAGGLREWEDDDSGDDDIEVEHMHLPPRGHGDESDQSPWPAGRGPADGLDVLLRPWPVDVGGGWARASAEDITPFIDARPSPHDLDAVLDTSIGGIGEDDSPDLTVDLPLDIFLE